MTSQHNRHLDHKTCPSGRASAMIGIVPVIVVLCLTIVIAGGCASRDDRPRTGAAWTDSPTDTRFDAAADTPPTPDTMYGLARILLAQGRPVESITLLRNTIGQYPRYLPAYNALAEAHLWLGQTDEALQALAEGLRRGPNDPVLLNNYGMTLFLEQRYEEALPHFERAANLRPEDPTYRANQAAALGMLGRTTEARELYRPLLPAADVGANIQVLERARRSSDHVSPHPSSPPQAAADAEERAAPTVESR